MTALAALLALAQRSTVRAEATHFVQRVELEGAARTRPSTLLELLPREPPASFTDRELAEYERRVGNLAIFDAVAVTLAADVLRVRVREKWTLIPSFDLATGKTVKDLYVEAGAVEYNAFGTGTSIGLTASYVQRGPNVAFAYSQHGYRPGRWTMGLEAAYQTAELRFDAHPGWTRRRMGGAPYWSAPLPYSLPLRFTMGVSYYYERIDALSLEAESGVPLGQTTSRTPPDGHELGLFVELALDRYRWHDLAPHGYSLTLTLTPGYLLGPRPAEPRSNATLELLASLRLSPTTALMLRHVSGAGTRGNPNYSFLLGSYEGVRGLDDAFYRNWLQTYANLELRQALRIAARWALQAVLFADGAAFAPLNADGQRAGAQTATCVGAGVRLVPLLLSELVLRFDVAELLHPERGFFYQLGVTQYF